VTEMHSVGSAIVEKAGISSTLCWRLGKCWVEQGH